MEFYSVRRAVIYFIIFFLAKADAKERNRTKRASENEIYKYDYDYYDDDYMYSDEEKKEDEETMLEKWNTMYKTHVVGAVIIGNILFCCCCCFCKFCKIYCEERFGGCCDSCLKKVDMARGRYPEYRDFCKAMKKLDIEPPTYDQWMQMFKAYGANPHINLI